MSLDGPRRWATRRRGTARHRAAAGRAKSSGLTWILRSWVTGTRFPSVECTVHATTKHHRRQVRSALRRQSGAWLPTRRLKSIFLASNGLQKRMNDPLAQRLNRRERLPPEEARRIMMETADALGAGHALGIIHRDVKPDNILLEGSRGRTVLTDFGIAKALTSTTGPGTLTATGVAIGTPHYMSPEQAAGDREIDGRSDIYSL